MLLSDRMQRVCFRLADLFCGVLAFAAAYALLMPARNMLYVLATKLLPPGSNPLLDLPEKYAPSFQELSWIFVVSIIALSLTLEYGERSWFSRRPTYRSLLLLPLVACGVATGVIATIFQAFKVPLYSRLFVVSYLLLLYALTAGYRIITKITVRRSDRSGNHKRRIVLAGNADGINMFLATMKTEPPSVIHDIRGCLLVDGPGSETPNIPVLGDIASLGDLLIHEPIDEVIIILPNGEISWLAEAIQHCDYLRVTVRIIHQSLMGMKLSDLTAVVDPQRFGSIQFIPEEELSTDRLISKRILDVVLSLAGLVALLPLLLLIALAIKVTTPRLPILYKWHVVGYRGRRFTGYKFTTMVADADARKQALGQLNEMTGPVFKIRNDPRITRLGKFLRKYSLNELPQLWSVLVGDMSLVGPRPAGPHELARYAPWHKRKLSVQPGITCFWQVRGRNLISDFDDWVKMDLEYIQKRSVLTDVSILLHTVSVVVRGTGS